MNDVNTSTDSDTLTYEHGAHAKLLDENQKIYRFSGGICRAMSKIHTPWHLSTKFYKQGDGPISYRTVDLEAKTSVFGVPPPGKGPAGRQRYGRDQEVIDLTLAPPTPKIWEADKVRDALSDPLKWGAVQTPPFPFSSAFDAYTDNGEDVVLTNSSLNAGVYCGGGDELNAPNPRCQGFIFLDSDEVASFYLSYESLIKLEEIVESITSVAKAMRTPCQSAESGVDYG